MVRPRKKPPAGQALLPVGPTEPQAIRQIKPSEHVAARAARMNDDRKEAIAMDKQTHQWRAALFGNPERLEELYQSNAGFSKVLDRIREEEAQDEIELQKEIKLLQERAAKFGKIVVLQSAEEETDLAQPRVKPTNAIVTAPAEKNKPGRKPGSTPAASGDVADKIMNYLKSHGKSGKKDIVEKTGLSDGQWNAAIKTLVESKKVHTEGERRGAKYWV